LADNDGKSDRRWKGWERLPIDIFGQDRFENRFVWLVRPNRAFLRFAYGFLSLLNCSALAHHSAYDCSP
jgi:hypothetical protein